MLSECHPSCNRDHERASCWRKNHSVWFLPFWSYTVVRRLIWISDFTLKRIRSNDLFILSKIKYKYDDNEFSYFFFLFKLDCFLRTSNLVFICWRNICICHSYAKRKLQEGNLSNSNKLLHNNSCLRWHIVMIRKHLFFNFAAIKAGLLRLFHYENSYK